MTVLMSMASPVSTVAGVAHDVRRTLSQGLTDQLVFTADDYTPGSNTVKLREITRKLAPGSLMSRGEATFYVVSVPDASTLVEVMPGYDGGPDIPIEAGSPLRVNPRFTDYTLFQAISSAVAAMASPANGLFGVKVDEVTGLVVDDYYPIPVAYAEQVQRVLSVQAASDGTYDWVPLRPNDYLLSLTPGSQHLRIFTDAQRYRITYATTIMRPTSFDTDLLTACHLTESMLDIPALGAASMLMSGQEARRVNQRAQGDPRRAEDVPITGATAAARDLRRLFSQRIDEEYARQISLYSYRVG